MSGANADEVIQKRLLSKVEKAKDELGKLYDQKADILKNQLSSRIRNDLKPYADRDDFIDV